ncbi:hypothetical protein [Myxococcus qinghaiensis]|uniref:hypothetical protein n=1 Tax=Myxococcus qinghaiensis TaxID=2906758 RepID=UPI0020A76064|nr:hypothetical protein [Myxococcus qinghaiensis]MCP3169710.1 hypothetical protein [Myxococcus qinghaiensis]
MTSGKKGVVVLVSVFVMMIFLCMGQVWVMSVPFLLAFGWLSFLKQVVPEVTLRWGAIVEFLVVAAVLGTGSHLFLRWLWRQLHAQAPEASTWRPRWSVSLLLVGVLLFAATMASVGVGHHVGWLMSGRARLVRSSWPQFEMEGVRTSHRLCDEVRELVDAGIPPEQLTRKLFAKPSLHALLEAQQVFSRVGPEGERVILVAARDPRVRERDGEVRCVPKPSDSEVLDAKTLKPGPDAPGTVKATSP